MKKIGKYEILEEIGRGSMGVVYKAHDPLIDRQVAIKVILKGALEIPKVKERFYREARTAGKLSHENITMIYDLGDANDKTYIVMEYLSGHDLRYIIDKKEPLTMGQKLEYAKQICRGLHYAHSHSIIHRDIKPENIKILEDGRVKIMDFGIAKPDTSTLKQASLETETLLTQAGMRIGTPWYMSPEQVRGSPVDRRSDIFSFGVLLYEILTYQKPFKGDDTTVLYKILHEEPEAIKLEESSLSDELLPVVLKCLEKEPDARYNDCSELLNDLGAVFDKTRQEKRIKDLLAEGHSLAKQKQLNKAILKFNEILQIDPNHKEANLNIKKLIESEKESATLKILSGRITGDTISHFKIIQRLGGGGMGVVYKAEDISLKRIVALKFLLPELTSDEAAKKRFFKEAQTASALDHPNICAIHEINETEDGLIFICMAYYEGQDLREKVSKGKLEISECLDIITRIARGLAKAHEHGVVHRDIKPANIILTTNGEVKIVDFGLAKLSRGATRITEPGMTVGTLPYMSPEQVKGALELDQRSDIWSFGVLLYEMLTGHLPFQGDYEVEVLHSIVNEAPIPASKLNVEIPSQLEEIINKALTKEVDDRYTYMEELLDDLEHFSGADEARLVESAKLIENGKICLNKKEYSDALSRFEAALKLDPKNQEVLDLIEQCENKQKELPRFNKLLSDGKEYFEKGNYKKALNAFKEIIAIDPDHSESHELIEKIQKKIKQMERVDKQISEANSYLNKKKFEKAIEIYKEILKVEPQNQKGLAGLQQAERALARLAEMASLIAEGKTYLKDNNYSDALSRFEAALKLDPKNQEVLDLIEQCENKQKEQRRLNKLLSDGKKYFENGNYKKALDAFKKIIVINPNHAEANDFNEKIEKKVQQSETVDKLLSDALYCLKHEKFEQAFAAYKQILEIEPENKDATRGQKRAKKGIEQKVKRPTVPTSISTEKSTPKALWFALIVILVVIGIAGSWLVFHDSNQGDRVDLSGPASAAKQTMLDLKSEAMKVDSENWAEATYKLALRAEQRGDKEFAADNVEAAKQAFVEAKDFFVKSLDEAKEAKRDADIATANFDQLKNIVAAVKQEMLREKTASEKVVANRNARKTFEKALGKQREGDMDFQVADRNGLLSAQIAYTDARDGFKAAREEALRNDAETVRLRMLQVKRNVPGNPERKSDNPKYQRAVQMELSGGRQFQTQDFGAARDSFRQARGLYRQATDEIMDLIKRSADVAKQLMLAAKSKIDVGYHGKVEYQDAAKIEKEADNAYNNNNFAKAAERYESAGERYLTVSSEAEEKIASEGEQEETAQREIQSLTNKYQEFFESSDIQALKTLLDLTAEAVENWSEFFKIAHAIKVNIESENLQINRNIANVDLFITIGYLDNKNRNQAQDLKYTWTFQKISGEWIVSKIVTLE
ncbi:MAG: serine/threonine-protein kinase [Caldithrix sp.]|nr:MAG: serine/threonine-protein kinase [Caldithrix sp.]